MNGGFTSLHPAGPPAFGLYDAHVHLGPSDTGELYYPPLEAPEYRSLLARAGGVCANAFPPYRTDGYAAANASNLAAADASGGALRALARLGGRPVLPEARLWLLRRKLRGLLGSPPKSLHDPAVLNQAPGSAGAYHGVKLLPHLDGLPDAAAFAAIRARRLPVLVHGGRFCSPKWIAKTLLPRTTGPLLIAHLGAFPAEEGMFADALEIARREERVFLDTSGVWVTGFLRAAAEAVPDKLVFGSDCPLADPLVAWQQVASIIGDEPLRRRVGRETAERIFGGV